MTPYHFVNAKIFLVTKTPAVKHKSIIPITVGADVKKKII